jgi:hypothetical protein
MGTGNPSRGQSYLPVCGANHSPTSNAEVKNEWSYTYTPPMDLHAVRWEKTLAAVLIAFFPTLRANESDILTVSKRTGQSVRPSN